MAKLIWFSRPSNHSGYLNLLYLSPDGDVGRERAYTDVLTGYFIMGGPEIVGEDDDLTDAGRLLLSRLEKGFHFYPASSEAKIREAVDKNRRAVTAKLKRASREFEGLSVFSKDLNDFQCLSLLLNGEEPASPVALVDRGDWERGDGLAALCEQLALLYYRMPKAEREALKLGPDWKIPST